MAIVSTLGSVRRTLVVAPFSLLLFVPAVTAGTAGTAAEDVSTSTTVAYGYDLENDPENCINFLPRPNCGREPQQAGDRGGALQYALLAVVLAALGTIGAVVVRNVIRRDRALTDRVTADRVTAGRDIAEGDDGDPRP